MRQAITLFILVYFINTSITFAQCATTTTLTDVKGSVESNSFEVNSSCEWLVEPLDAQYILLDFGYFSIGDNDVLSIYKGTSADGELLVSYSGYQGSNLPMITVESSSVFFKLEADDESDGNSFDIDYIGVNGEMPELLEPEISPSVLCQGDSYTIYIMSSGTFPTEYPFRNEFKIILSDPSGSFDNDNTIELETTYSNGVTFELPEGVKDGDNYKFRVESTYPKLTSPATDGDIEINNMEIIINTTDTKNYSIDVVGGDAPYEYKFEDNEFSSDNTFSDILPGQVYEVTVKDGNGCTKVRPFKFNSPQDCNVLVEAGGQGTTFTTHELGAIPGKVFVNYEMFTIKDQMDIFYDGELVASTDTLVSGSKTLSFDYEPGTVGPYNCVIRIYAPLEGTKWDYKASCPVPTDADNIGVNKKEYTCSKTVTSPSFTTKQDLEEKYTTTYYPSELGKSLQYSFNFIGLQGNISIYDGEDSNSPKLGSYSGTYLSEVVGGVATNEKGALTVVYTPYTWNLEEGSPDGFSFDIFCVENIPPTEEISETAVTTCNYRLSTPNYPDRYVDGESYIQTIYAADEGKQIYINFDHFDLSYYDELYVYNGSSTSSESLGSAESDSEFISNNSEGALTIHFDQEVNGYSNKGFLANIKCVDPLSFKTLKFIGQVGLPIVDEEYNEILINMGADMDIYNFIPRFTLYPGVSAYVDEVQQFSGVSAQNFSSPVDYVLTNGETSKKWTVYFVNLSNKGNQNNPIQSLTNIKDYSLDEGFSTKEIDITGVFVSLNDEELTYDVISDDENVVTVSIEDENITITEEGPGTANVTIIVIDESGNEVDFDFKVKNKVNLLPYIASPWNGKWFTFDNYIEINLNEQFKDPEGDELTYTYTSSNDDIFTITDGILRYSLSDWNYEFSKLVVTATDQLGRSISDSLWYSQENIDDEFVTRPYLRTPLSDYTIYLNSDLTEYTLEYNLEDKFIYPSNFTPSFEVVSSDESLLEVYMEDGHLKAEHKGISGEVTVTILPESGKTNSQANTQITVYIVDEPFSLALKEEYDTLNFYEGFIATSVDLNEIFSYDGEKKLSYSILEDKSDEEIVYKASLSNNYLNLEELGIGEQNITLRVRSEVSIFSNQQLTIIVKEKPNFAPNIVQELDDKSFYVGFENYSIDFEDVFEDPDNDRITYAVTNSNEDVVTVELVQKTIKVTEVAVGSSTITLTATDKKGASTSIMFDIHVTTNKAPEVITAVENQIFDYGFKMNEIDLSNVFSDPEEDAITFTVSVDEASIVSVKIEDDHVLKIEEGTTSGTTTITVVATDDGSEISVEHKFEVTVNPNQGPELIAEIEDKIFDFGFETYELDLSDNFSDPEGDELTFSASVEESSIATVSVDGNILMISSGNTDGTTTITVVATDAVSEESEEHSFEITMNPNQGPIIISTVTTKTLGNGFTTYEVDLSEVFSDPEGDELSFETLVGDDEIVSVTVNNSTLVLTEGNKAGTTTITVVATDAISELSESISFDVVVTEEPIENESPIVINKLDDLQFVVGFISHTINISNVFEDADNHDLTFEASSSDESVIEVELVGNILTLNEVGEGTAEVLLKATDIYGANVSVLFSVKVGGNRFPVLDKELENLSFEKGFVSHTIKLSDHFSDPESDDITYTVEQTESNILDISIANDELLISEKGIGSSEITITASDFEGAISRSFTVIVNNTVSSLNDLKDIGISFYPNPVNDYIEIDNQSLSITSVSIWNMQGVEIKKIPLSGDKTKIDLSSLPSGVYMFTVLKDEHIYSTSLIKK